MTVAESTPGARTPIHLWMVGILALLWNLVGVFDYLATQFRWEFYMDQFTQQQLDYFYGFPSWMVAAWAIAVWASFLGAVGLLLRKRWAVWCFAAALVGLLLSTLYNFVLSNGMEIMGSKAAGFTLFIWVVAIFLLWYSWQMARNGVLR